MRIAVVAYDEKRAIGAGNDLPWGRALPADLANFKKLTLGKTIIMGRKTFESIGSRPLPKRQNIVLSRQATGIQGVITAASLEAAYALAQYPVVIIGGERVFSESLAELDRIYATEVKASFSGTDRFFLDLDPEEWQETSRQPHPSDKTNKYPFDLVIYERAS